MKEAREAQAALAISIHAPLAGCDKDAGERQKAIAISIHAPLAGCDPGSWWPCAARFHFNPRTPCGVRQGFMYRGVDAVIFQSTHPLRGATRPRPSPPAWSGFQSTHPLRGATAPTPTSSCRHNYFNPRTPCGVRPAAGTSGTEQPVISIHAPLAGCDRGGGLFPRRIFYFNPRTPCGVRPARPCSGTPRCHFNPRTPCGVRPNGFFQYR